jgi:hypothetical protein
MRFDVICGANGIESGRTKLNHPWINGQVEQMNRTIKNTASQTAPLRLCLATGFLGGGLDRTW